MPLQGFALQLIKSMENSSKHDTSKHIIYPMTMNSFNSINNYHLISRMEAKTAVIQECSPINKNNINQKNA